MVSKGLSTDKRIKQLIVNCECGCGQQLNVVRYANESEDYDVNKNKSKKSISYDYYLNFSGSLFYEKQQGIFRIIGTRLKNCWKILRGKEYTIYDICIDEEDIDNMIKGLKEIKNGK